MSSSCAYRFLFLIAFLCYARVEALGENRIFQIRHALSGDTLAITATRRVERSYRPGFPLSFWVEDAAWENPLANGLDPDGVDATGSPLERQALLEDFARFVEQTLVAPLESSQFSFLNPDNASLDGLHFLLLDVPDGFSDDPAEDQRKGSAVLARLDPDDLSSLKGLNNMNLVQIDLNPGTLGRSLVSGIEWDRSLYEIARVLGRLLFYQRHGEDEVWLEEGFNQYVAYRLLNQKPGHQSSQRVLDAPTVYPSEVNVYGENPYLVYPGFTFLRSNLDRVFFFETPRDLQDNRDFSRFRGFSYLFFTWLFHRMGGNFLTQLSDGDRFFQNVLLSNASGVEALAEPIQAAGLQFPDLLEEFQLSLLSTYREGLIGFSCCNISRPAGFTNMVEIETSSPQIVTTLERFQAHALRMKGQNTSSIVSGTLGFPASLAGMRVLGIQKDSEGDWFLESSPSREAILATTLTSSAILSLGYENPGVEEKLLLTLNTSDGRRQYQASATTRVLTRGLVLLASNQNFGTVSTAIEIDAADLPITATTVPIRVTVNGAGVFEIKVTNTTTSPLIWSLLPVGSTTGISLNGHGAVKLSQSRASLSTTVLGGGTSLIQRAQSSLNLVILHEVARSAEMELVFSVYSGELLPAGSGSGTSGGTPISEEEYRRLAGGGGGGCFVVTAASGGSEHWLVRFFCRIRDEVLLRNDWGTWMMECYYHHSPALARTIQGSDALRMLAWILLIPFGLLGILLFHPWLILALGIGWYNIRGKSCSVF